MDGAFATAYSSLRLAVAVLVGVALVLAVAAWAVRTGRIGPRSPLAGPARGLTDPLLRPLERRILRLGGNPVDAPVWLVGLVVAGGLLLLGLLGWIQGIAGYLRAMAGGGPRAWGQGLVSLVYFVLVLALVIRVLGGWFGLGRYHRWGRHAYRLTDWLVEPIRRRLPPTGALDLSPLVAFVALWIARYAISAIIGV